MGISESSKLYLKNYYILEQARSETRDFLAEIAKELADRFDEYLTPRERSNYNVTKWIQNEGGRVQFSIAEKPGNGKFSHLGKLNFAIFYEDAIRVSNLKSPLECRIYGFSPVDCKRFETEVRRMAESMGLPDPYRVLQTNVLEKELDETVSLLLGQFIGRYEDIVRILDTIAAAE